MTKGGGCSFEGTGNTEGKKKRTTVAGEAEGKHVFLEAFETEKTNYLTTVLTIFTALGQEIVG